MLEWNHRNCQDRLYNRSSLSSRGCEFNGVSGWSNLLWKWTVGMKRSSIWKKMDIRNVFWKVGWFVGGNLTFLWFGQIMVSDDMCDKSCSALLDEWRYFANPSLSWFWWVTTVCRISSKGKFEEAFYKLSGDLLWSYNSFWHLRSFSPMCFLVKSWPLWMIYFEAPISVHFCLINLVMVWKIIEIKEFIFVVVVQRLYESILKIEKRWNYFICTPSRSSEFLYWTVLDE